MFNVEQCFVLLRCVRGWYFTIQSSGSYIPNHTSQRYFFFSWLSYCCLVDVSVRRISGASRGATEDVDSQFWVVTWTTAGFLDLTPTVWLGHCSAPSAWTQTWGSVAPWVAGDLLVWCWWAARLLWSVSCKRERGRLPAKRTRENTTTLWLNSLSAVPSATRVRSSGSGLPWSLRSKACQS